MRLVLGDRLAGQQNRFVIRRMRCMRCMSWSLRPVGRSFSRAFGPLAVATLATVVALAALFAILEAPAASATPPPSSPLACAFALFPVFRSLGVPFFLLALFLFLSCGVAVRCVSRFLTVLRLRVFGVFR